MPWAPDVQVIYEHLHRYLWAAELLEGRRVLDLASGEGFGAAIMARSATSVTGIDIDRQTVDHSSLNYGSDTVTFQLGDARDLSAFDADSFDAVIAFEMIEHVDDQEGVLSGIARVLSSDGLLIMSTPDRRAYRHGDSANNPFHVREMDGDEFAALLSGQFEHRAIWGQRTVTGSALAAIGSSTASTTAEARTYFVEPQGDEWALADGLSALYFVAVASNAPLPPIAANSTLADGDQGLLRAVERAAEERVGRGIAAAAQRENAERERVLAVNQALERADRELAEARRTVADREIELLSRRSRLAELAAAGERGAEEMELLRAELMVAQHRAAEMTQSVTWRAYRRGRDRLWGLVGGPRSRPARAMRFAMREIGRLVESRAATELAAADGARIIELPEFESPKVSLVIPCYSGAELTRSCLESILDKTSAVSYEVLVVDDSADPATKALLGQVRGARILVNETNLGYLRSVNRAAAAARGEWIVLCNNDIQVIEGWLSAMLSCGESADDVAVVTPKYLYPDWSLNEAGAIIWRDGTGTNYGRGAAPAESRFEFRREVDYGSAAALMVRTDFWNDVGGFDERYLPMYYEDTDLCFQARERGLRVMFEPRANVVHIEGGTAGTDLYTGYKRFQEINRVKFVDKWRGRLDAEQLSPGRHNERRGSDRGRGPRVLIVDHRVPMWDRDSGSLRMKGMVEALLQLGCRVTFLPDDRHLVLPYTVELQRMGVEVWYGEVNIAAELATIGPELAMVIACRPHTTSHWLDLIRELAPTAAVIYDTVDLHWLRESRRSSGGVVHGSKAAALREVELALIRACDATLVVTAEEGRLVRADVPQSAVWIAPNVNVVRAVIPGLEHREGVIFIGGFEHTPNAEAVFRLVRRVMPIVWQRLGRVPVTIVGGATPEIRELASGQIEIAGWVPDVDPLFDRARAMVAPLTWGAGLKGKVTQSLAMGLPVVTTGIGAEGLDARDGHHLLIADSDEDLAERVILALTDDNLWQTLSNEGQQLVDALCSPRVMENVMSEILAGAPELRAGTFERADPDPDAASAPDPLRTA